MGQLIYSSTAIQPYQLYLHELSHNYQVGHAAVYEGNPPSGGGGHSVDERAELVAHGDWSCAMGFCCQTRCLNAPHAWQVSGMA